LHLILPPYYIKLCNECCTQQQPQLPHPCEEEIRISSFLSWNFQSTNQKNNTGGATSNPKLPNTQKLILFSSLLVSKANPPKKTNLIRNKTKDKSLQTSTAAGSFATTKTTTTDQASSSSSFLSLFCLVSKVQLKTHPPKKGQNLQLQVLTATGG
jgi:hypothetical protein